MMSSLHYTGVKLVDLNNTFAIKDATKIISLEIIAAMSLLLITRPSLRHIG